MSRNPEDLTPEMQVLYQKFYDAMEEAGLKFILTCTKRPQAEQDALFAQGRATLDTVNFVRKKAGLAPITEKQNFKVTWTRDSNHKDGKAFDVAMLDKNGKVTWQEIAYKAAGKVGKSVGLVWGGDWKSPDLPHFEMPKDHPVNDENYGVA